MSRNKLVSIVNIIMLCAMLFGMVAPVAQLGMTSALAQESTEEPAAETTAEAASEAETATPTAAPPPTSAPTEPVATESEPEASTPEITEEPVIETTDEPTVESTETVEPELTEEPTAEATEEPAVTPTEEVTQETTQPPTETAVPTPDPELTEFGDNFEDGDTSGWTLSPGWALTSSASGDNLFLRGIIPNARASVDNLDWPHLSLRARLRVQPGSTAEVIVRDNGTESYRVTLDAAGLTSLYRDDVLLAQGTALEPDIEQAVWRTITVQALGQYITVALDGNIQFTYEDPAPLEGGLITFMTGAENTGAVDLDDVVITKLEAPALPDEGIIVTEPAPETTDEPEATQEPESTEEPEATEEPVSDLVPVPLLSADFEGELSGWVASEGAVAINVSDTNSALLMTGGHTFIPASELALHNLRLDAGVNFLTAEAGSLNIVFRSAEGSSYVIAFENAQTTLYRSDADGLTSLASVSATHEPGIWHHLRLEAIDSQITLFVNDAAELSFVDETPLAGGAVALAVTGDASLFLDDVTLYEMLPADQVVTPTPLPVYLVTEELSLKLADKLYQTLRLLEAGDQPAAFEYAAATNLHFHDDALSVDVTVWPADGDAESLTSLVEQHGGAVTATYRTHLDARIPLWNIIALANADAVATVDVPDVAASTSSGLSAALAPAQQESSLPHSLSIIGWKDWNQSSITGSGVKIAVIDKAGTHRDAVVELVKAIAPGASVNVYTASNASTLASAINSARSGNNNIILITLDLGVHVSPGDGTANNGTGQGIAGDVYTRIQQARNEGRLVIVSAGNNTTRQVGFEYTNQNTTVNFEAQQGTFIINVVWNGWGDSSFVPSNISGGGINFQNSPNNRVNNNTPGYQLSGNCNQPTCNIALNLTGGNGAGRFVQVQLNSPGRFLDMSGATPDTTVGNIARPADSPHALAVGAVCAVQNTGGLNPKYYPPMHDSSHGPIYAAGGSGPASVGASITRDDFKPDLVAPSHVVSSKFNPDVGDCMNNGFNGTSAASAHVAGMAALLLSNNSMAAQIKNASNPANALHNYLQTHVIDLFAAANDGFPADYGFDNVYGAGLTVLGNPAYDLSQIENPLSSGGANVLYVGLADPGSEQTGEFDKPFIHLSKAIAEASSQGISRIVLLPGEYTSGIEIIGRSNLSIEGYNGLATMWVNNNYLGQAGIQIENSTGITLDAITFQAADPMKRPDGIPFDFIPPVAIQFYNGTLTNAGGSAVSNSTFSGFKRQPIIIDGTYGVSIVNNVFENINVAGDLQNRAALYILNAPATDGRIMVRGNTFRNIQGTIQTANSNKEAIVRVEGSAVDFYGNFFLNTNAETVLNLANNANDGTQEVNLFSNLFLNNNNVLVYLNPAPQVRFINNTVVNQNPMTDDRALLLRSGSTDYRWAVHNNLFYNNGANNPNFLITSQPAIFSLCQALDNDTIETGARNNWVINTRSNFSAATCDKSFKLEGVPQNNNLLSDALIPAQDIFVGADPIFGLNPNVDALYYQLRQDADGIDGGDAAVLLPPLLDFTENTRASDGNGDDIQEPDIGAFELVPLTAGPIDVVRFEDDFGQLNDRSTAFAIDLRQGVDGGFAPYSFKIKSFPVNFSTDPSDFCLGTGLRIQGNFAYYCPPAQFYTDDSHPDIPDNVQFEYYAFDRLSDTSDLENAVFNTVTIDIQPVNDQPLTNPINYQMIVEAGSAFRFRLRPSVRFNNFRFSELGTTRHSEADYPFTYNTNIDNVDTNNPNVLEHGGMGLQAYIEDRLNNPNPDGTITLQSANGERGYVEFSYQVTDAHSSTITNTVRLEVVGLLPDSGLHDDTSFSFRYNTLNTGSGVTDGWQAIANPGSINNTLHLTSKLNDVASFDFIGEGFVLYMQAQGSGSLWELRIDDREGVNPPLTWVKQLDGSWLAQRDGYNCITRVNVSGNLISNNGKNPYTVTCDGLRADEGHTVQIINRQAKKLAVDALAILFDAEPLLPGVHDIVEHDIFTLFAGWQVVNDAKASNGMALATTSDDLNDIIFHFRGSGIAIGTTLEGVLNGGVYHGADYDICITPQVNTVYGEEVCQNFNNGVGAGRGVTWGVFRPFYGYNYNPLAAAPDTHRVRIRINSIPSGTRLVIDSINVLSETPTEILTPENRVTEDDQLGPIVFGNGTPGSWLLNTSVRNASNNSLTALARNVVAAGPFIGFHVPADADLIHWYRQPGKRDSQDILVCVDRAQGEAGITDHCLPFNLLTAPNPLIIRESDFGGWGDGWGDHNIHTIEIFSLSNAVFNLDKVEVFSSTAPLTAGFYEDLILAANNGAFGFFDSTGGPLNGGSFQIIQDKSTAKASGGSVARTDTANEGALFQMTGTGFTVYFTQNKFAGDVRICWLSGTLTTDVAQVEASGHCQTYTNYSSGNVFQAGHAVVGLPQGNHTVTVRNLLNGTRQQMQLDAIQIIDDTMPGTILTAANPRYETSFANRLAEDTFLYYGNWQSLEGNKAKKYSAQNYDLITNSPGAAIVFQTQGIDTLRIARTAKRGFASMQICIDGTEGCLDIPGDRDPAVVHLASLLDEPFSMVEPHIISLVLTSRGRFELDAIDVFDASTPLPPGFYEEDEPLLKYDTNWNNQAASKYTNRRAQQTTTAGAEMLFHMNGSIFELGLFVKSYNQVEICYVPGIQTDPALVADNCQNFPQNNGQSLSPVQVFNSGTLNNDVANYSVRVRNNNAAAMWIDYVHILNSFDPLTAGRYENTHPILLDGAAGAWTTLTSKNSSGGSYLQTQVADDYLQFEIEGTGFGIGTFTNSNGSEMLVCYIRSSDVVGDWDGTGGECVTFQNEVSKASVNITRSITGLPPDTYTVRVVNDDNGNTELTNPPSPRNLVTNPPTLVVDFVEVYAGLPALLQAANGGTFNEDAADSGDSFIQLLPADRWGTITDKSANTATDGSYASVLDVGSKVTNAYAGQSATFWVELPANSTSTLILDLFKADNKNSDQLQYCIVGGDSDISIVCDVLTTARNQRYQAVTLENNTGGPVTRTVHFSNLTPGFFRIDGFQFVPGNILGAGVYDNILMDNSSIFDTGPGWSQITNKQAVNGSVHQTTMTDSFVQFRFAGTGFAIGTPIGPQGSEVDICYLPASETFDGTWDGSGEECLDFQNQISKSSTTISRSVVGLPEDTYVVGVINRDDGNNDLTNPPSLRDPVSSPPTLVIDYVEIFDAELPPVLDLTASGGYNEDAAEGGAPYLQLLPASRWLSITDKSANNATERSYASVVNDKGKPDSNFAGPTVALRVLVGANSQTTITLDTFASGKGHSDQLRYCVLNGATIESCDTLDTMPTSQFHVVTLNNPTGSNITRTIFFQTLTPGFFRIDRFQLLQGNTLGAGLYEDFYIEPDGLIDANGSGWQTVTNKSFSNGSSRQTTNAATGVQPTGDFIQFEFFGTGFAIGTPLGRTGSEMRICYQTKALFDPDSNFFDGAGEECLDFQNEARSTSQDVIRSVTGLPQDTYVVGVLHRDDGFSNLTAVPGTRDSRFPATLIIDFVQIFNEPAPAVIAQTGMYNEDATNGLDEAFIQLLPANHWGTISGKAAKGATGESYVSVVDSKGRVFSKAAGSTATMRIQVDANSSATLALNTFAAGKNHSDQLLYCILDGASIVECNTLNTMPASPQQIITINNAGKPLTTYTVFLQTLTPGFFRIDGFQFIQSTVLTEGIYDNHFMTDGGLIDLDGNWALPPASGTKVKKAFGGEVIRTQTQGAELTFAFEGSGFSIITLEDSKRLGIEVCYVPMTQFNINGFADATCHLNSTEITKGKFEQYGVGFYGLHPNTYMARITVTQAPASLKTDWFTVDALVIFGDVTAGDPLTAGMYDDADLLNNPAVRFAPEVFWNANPKVKNGPPKGPWQLTEQQAVNAGSVLQIFVEGNTLTLYQQFNNKNSESVKVCLVVFGTQANELQCNTFSQKGKGDYFTPIAFFGLGDGQHQVIFENKAPKKPFNVDAIRVAP